MCTITLPILLHLMLYNIAGAVITSNFCIGDYLYNVLLLICSVASNVFLLLTSFSIDVACNTSCVPCIDMESCM